MILISMFYTLHTVVLYVLYSGAVAMMRCIYWIICCIFHTFLSAYNLHSQHVYFGLWFVFLVGPCGNVGCQQQQHTDQTSNGYGVFLNLSIVPKITLNGGHRSLALHVSCLCLCYVVRSSVGVVHHQPTAQPTTHGVLFGGNWRQFCDRAFTEIDFPQIVSDA